MFKFYQPPEVVTVADMRNRLCNLDLQSLDLQSLTCLIFNVASTIKKNLNVKVLCLH